MKKTALFLVAMLVLSMLTLSSCSLLEKVPGIDKIPGIGDLINKPCTEHVDADSDYVCDNCGEGLQHDDPQPEPDPDPKPEPEPEPEPEHECADADKDHKCDVCDAKLSEHEEADDAHHCSICGAKLSDHEAAEGSHDCVGCGMKVSDCEDADSNFACDVCGAELIPDTHEKVEYCLNISDLDAGVRSDDEINGKFTIVSGTEVRNRTKTYNGVEYNKSVKIGGNAHKIVVSVPGTGTLRFIIQNGSSGVDMQFTKVIAPDGTVKDIEFVAGAESNPLVMIEVEVTAGEWTITRGKNGGTQDIFELSLSCVVEKSPENGFELVSAGKTEFLTNGTLDVSKLVLNSTYENGKTEPLDLTQVSIDTSAVNMAEAGVYPITLTYKDYEPISYNVSVFAPESLKLGFDAIEKLSQNSSAGNGVYYNHSFKEVYLVDEEFDAAGLSVIVVAKCGEATLEFLVNDYTVEGFDSSYSDYNVLTISAYGVSEQVEIHVVDTTPTPNSDGVYQLLVDPDYEGIAAAISGPYHVFKTIQGALDYAENIDKSAVKELYIAPGLYKEKLEITIPNIKIIGWGETPDQVVIEWDSLYGLVDAGGFTHTTDSTATVAIRDGATNVTIENVTISNYWNSQERMDKAGLAIERGLALLVQADRFVMKNSKLLGIQDTLELFTGRQYFENVFISGYTDFVFGTNNTTYFKNCTIHVIDTEKDDKGTAGYITAFKGSNKGAGDAIVYGAIFDNCKFTADEGVTPGCTAIGRPWGAYAAVAVINSELGGHISVAGFTGGKNERYVSMNAKPTDATVQYVEYNNTGAGAITEAVAGMRMLTAEEAALYADFAVIFGTTNGQVTYLDPWNPESTEIVVDDRTYYYFNGVEGTSGTSYTYMENIQGATGTIGSLTIDATVGKLTFRGSDSQFNAGAKLIFNVEAGTLVTVISYPGYGYYTINGVAHNANDTFSMYFAEATEVVVEATSTSYIYQLIINPNEEAPDAPTLNEIKVSGFNTNYVLGDEISLEGVVINGYYSDNSVVALSDYNVDSSAVVNTAEGEYAVVFTCGDKSVTVTVTYEDPNAGPEISKDTVLDFTTPDGLAAVQNNPKVTIDGSVRHNGAEIQIKGTISFKVKAGTVVTVIPYANTSYASYTIGMEGEEDLTVYSESMATMFQEDCTVVYTGLDNNYLCQIIIQCPLDEGKYVFGGSSAEGDVTGILGSIPGMSISGTCATHSGGAQLGADSQIIFIAPALSTITIKGYDTSYGQLTVLADGVPVEMNASAQYVINVTCPITVIIEAKNVGTEDAPAWNKSYITYIQVDVPDFIEENTEITFGSAGNYKDSAIDFTGITIGDNGGNNSQIKNGSFSFAVRKGAIVTVHGYSGYTSYNFSDGDVSYDGITDEYFTYEVWDDCVITISHTEGNNYFYSVSIVYPVVFDGNTTIDLSATGANIQKTVGVYQGLEIDATNGKFADNNGGWTQVNAGTVIKLNVADGATVSVTAHGSADNFAIVIADGVCTITCNVNDYLKAITISY